MTSRSSVEVLIEADGVRFEGTGSAEEIISQIIQFLSQTIPTYTLAKKLIYLPDLSMLTEKVTEFAKMTSSGQLLLTRNDLEADRSILITLFMAHLAAKIGKRADEALDITSLVASVGKATKTIRNAIVDLQRKGLINRHGRGQYGITAKGLIELERDLGALKPDSKRADYNIAAVDYDLASGGGSK